MRETVHALLLVNIILLIRRDSRAAPGHAIVNVVLAVELHRAEHAVPAVCFSLSRNARNCFIPFATSRFVAFSMARSRPVVGYSTSFVVCTCWPRIQRWAIAG